MKLNENEDLRYIKKHYGEKFAQLCRSLFPTILEIEGLLKKIISSNFGPTRSLYEDFSNDSTALEELKTFINTCAVYDIEKSIQNTKNYSEETDPLKLFEKAGYILYPECKRVKDVEKFEKYYADGEELCTFNDIKGRLEECRIWFAVKKDVDKICRSDFHFPERQDKYGTSVLCLQFDKDTGSLSIKNRYNHGRNSEIKNPDATFSNNLDNIIPGLTKAFSQTYNIDLIGGMIFEFKENLNNYICANASDFKMYRVNTNIDNNSDFPIGTRDLVFCENNVVVENGNAIKFDKDKFLLFDNYLIDLHRKTITSYKNSNGDAFISSLGNYEKIFISQHDEFDNQTIIVTPKEGKNIEIVIDKHNSIIGYSNENVTEIGDNFLSLSKNVANLYMPKLKKAGCQFLNDNLFLQTYNLKNIEYIGDGFLTCNRVLSEIDMPNLKYVGDNFLNFNSVIEKINLPSLEYAGNCFLRINEKIKALDLQNLRHIGDKFLAADKILQNINIPNIEEIGNHFLYENNNLKSLSIPKVKTIGEQALYENEKLKNIDIKNVEKIGSGFLYRNISLNELDCPCLTSVGCDFLANNEFIKVINLPSLVSAKEYFLESANHIKSINVNSLKYYDKKSFLGQLSRLKFKELMKELEKRKEDFPVEDEMSDNDEFFDDDDFEM